MSGRGLKSLVSHLHSHQGYSQRYNSSARLSQIDIGNCVLLSKDHSISQGSIATCVSARFGSRGHLRTLTPTRRGVQRQPTRLASDHFARRKLTDKSHHHRSGSDAQAFEVDVVPRPSYGALRAWLRTFVCPRSRSFPRAALTGRQIPKGPKHNNSIAPHLRSKHIGDDVICHLQRSRTARASPKICVQP